jgi:hypothetical protein
VELVYEMDAILVCIAHEQRDDEGRAGECRVRGPGVFKEFGHESNGAHLSAAFLRTRARTPFPGALFAGRTKHILNGTMDYTGGDDGRQGTDAVAAELRRIGWKEGRDLEHFVDLKPLTEPELENSGLRRDKWKEAQTSQHNEFYWRLRAWRPLVFLFPPK